PRRARRAPKRRTSARVSGWLRALGCPPLRAVATHSRGQWADGCLRRGLRAPDGRRRRSRGGPPGAAQAPSFTGGFALLVARGADVLRAPGEEVVGRDVPDRAVQPHAVVVLDEVVDDASCVLQRRRRRDADGIALEGLVPPLQLAVRLRVMGR